MNEPIISPWLIYLYYEWRDVKFVLYILLLVLTTIRCVLIKERQEPKYHSGVTDDERAEQMIKYRNRERDTNRVLMYSFILWVLLVLIPRPETIMKMYVASNITQANITKAGVALDDATDTIIAKVIEKINKIKEERQ